jgi:hypothetical protein
VWGFDQLQQLVKPLRNSGFNICFCLGCNPVQCHTTVLITLIRNQHNWHMRNARFEVGINISSNQPAPAAGQTIIVNSNALGARQPSAEVVSIGPR